MNRDEVTCDLTLGASQRGMSVPPTWVVALPPGQSISIVSAFPER